MRDRVPAMLIPMTQRLRSTALRLAIAALVTTAPATATAEPGLAVSWSASGRTHHSSLPGVALYVAAGESPSPFLPPGPFTAVWEGSVQAELRGSFVFQAELAGWFRLELNGRTVLEASRTNEPSPVSAPIQLSKGSNAFKATFRSATTGDSFVRLGWTEQGTNFSPIPPSVLNHIVSPAQIADRQLALGRELFLEHRCLNCHAETRPSQKPNLPEQSMDAPTLAGIGSRRRANWLTHWVRDPRAMRPTARMPKLRGAGSVDDAAAVGAYLNSLTTPPDGLRPAVPVAYQTRQTPAGRTEPPAKTLVSSRSLYNRLNCDACHHPPNAPGTDPAKLSHRDLAEKFPRGRLAEYLMAPEAGYAWTRMPNFHLSVAEAKELEEFLLRGAAAAEDAPKPASAALIERGRQRVQSVGCLNCHSHDLPNDFKAPSLEATALSQDRAGGCLGSAPAVDFGFSEEQRAALRRFLREGLDSLRRHVPAEFAERETRALNCSACHGRLELIPRMEILGGKLRPEWSRRYMAGEIPHKIRFDQHPNGEIWVEGRMPAFKSRAADLARGLAALHGFPPITPVEGPVDPAAAESGRKLVGKSGGFSCVACHAVGPKPALEVFESEGINLAWSAERLQPSYYRRWFRNPLSVEPQTKMPVYFDDTGASPLTDVLEGNGDAQISAVWHYLRLAEKMPTAD